MSEVTSAAKSTKEEEEEVEEDEDESSHVSEGQLIPVSLQSYSDDSDISEEMTQGERETAACY